MISQRITSSFESWRDAARTMLRQHVEADQILWTDEHSTADALPFGTVRTGEAAEPDASPAVPLKMPREFVEQARLAACFRDPNRWSLLYRIAFRLTHGEPNLMSIVVDDDVTQLRTMAKAVSRDRHKMTAFVRFRQIQTDGVERFVAFHRPDHYIARLASSFFVERFGPMHWSILTPDESVHWNTKELSFGPGVGSRDQPVGDDIEAFWLTYYRSIFNPARIKVKHMVQELPKRHWSTLPEAALIPELIRSATSRSNQVQATAAHRAKTDVARVPPSKSLNVLRDASRSCTACDWAEKCTQTVFGTGPMDAKIVLVGEQPGDVEDVQGTPFVGPAGQLLRTIIRETGFDESAIYFTNAVKHFKYEPRGKRRIHQTPSARDVAVCRPWLEAELNAIKPHVLVCLGSTAAKSVLGHAFRITQGRGQWIASEWCNNTNASWHPSAILRVPDRQQADVMREQLRADLSNAFSRVV